jgi:hypothetical protein
MLTVTRRLSTAAFDFNPVYAASLHRATHISRCSSLQSNQGYDFLKLAFVMG